mgnify:CR=1 FL=1
MSKIMESVMENLKKHGAEGDLILSNSKSLKVSVHNGAINEYKVTGSQMMGIRVIKDDRVGISYTESLDPESLNLLVKQALDNAQIAEPNTLEKILKLSGEISDVAHYDEAPVEMSAKTQLALDLEAKMKALDSRITAVPYNGYSEGETHSTYLTSHGRKTVWGDKSFSITTSALMDDKGKKADFYDYQATHYFKDLNPKKIIDTAFFHAKNILEEKAIPTGRYQVRYTEDMLESLMGCFSNFYSAKAAIDKVNPWATKLGETVMSKDITLIDHPTYEGAFRRSIFDDEGLERKPLNLIEDGVLKSFLHNSVTAKHFKTESTAHAARGATSSLGVSGTHFLLKGKNPKSMPNKYLEVIQIDGLHSGANRVTGDFSFGVKGYIWENGERKGTFGNVTLSGNIIELFKNVEVVGSELKASTDHSFFTVPLVFNNQSIAGA